MSSALLSADPVPLDLAQAGMIDVAVFGECMLELSGPAFGAVRQGFGGDTLNTAVYLVRRWAGPPARPVSNRSGCAWRAQLPLLAPGQRCAGQF